MNILLFRIVQCYLNLEDQYNGLREEMLIPVYLLTIVQDHTQSKRNRLKIDQFICTGCGRYPL